jgi:hypothetical protein
LRIAAPENVQLAPALIFCVKSPDLLGPNAFSSIARTKSCGTLTGRLGSDGGSTALWTCFCSRRAASKVISLLLVDPDVTAAAAIVEALPASVDLDVRADFPAARARLHAQPPRLLITALRLREYNGLHLVYLAARAGLPTRSVIYTEVPDHAAALESRTAGAFYEVRPQLTLSLPSYVSALLPPSDRRDGIRFDRRHLSRGGRRSYDQRHTAALHV